MKRRMTRAAVLAMVLLMLVSALAEAKTMYLVEAAKLYRLNKTTSKVLAALDAGSAVNVLAVKKGWAKVKVGGKAGFMLKDALTAKAPDAQDEPDAPGGEPQETTMYAIAKIRLFKGKSTSSGVRSAIPANAAVTVKAAGKTWCAVTYKGKSGYVLTEKLSNKVVEAPDEGDAPPPSSKYETLKPGDSGEGVMKLQARLKALEWFYGDVLGNYKALTTQAVRDFQQAVGLNESGIADEATQKRLYASDAPRNVINSTAQPASGKSKEMDWWTSGIQEIFPRGATVVVTDVETGLSFRIVRSGGTNHADVQPKTAQDAAVMKKAYGGAWSWNRRAIWVSVGGQKYAASMNGMPHGSGSITTNNFDGHFCIHFTNSRTHGSNIMCALHQAAIRKAASAG